MAELSKSTLKEPIIRASEQLLIAGLQDHYTPHTVGNIPQLWQRLMSYLGKISGQVGRSTYGVGFNNSERGFDYIAGVEFSNLSGIPKEFSTLTIPSQKYYVFIHEGHVSEIPKTIGAIMNEWVPTSNYKFAALPSMLERYGEGFNPQTGTGDMEIWLPVGS